MQSPGAHMPWLAGGFLRSRDARPQLDHCAGLLRAASVPAGFNLSSLPPPPPPKVHLLSCPLTLPPSLHQRFVVAGGQLTEADIRLWATLVR